MPHTRRKATASSLLPNMKSRHLPAIAAAFCLNAQAAELAESVVITDPTKIVKSTTYDLGNRLMTVQEIAKDALPMPPAPVPPAVQPTPSPDFQRRPQREFGFLTLGGSVYRREGQPARTLVNLYSHGSGPISFWTSADWRLISGIGNLTDASGKDWSLMCMFSSYVHEPKDDSIVIPEFPPGPSTIKVVSGDPTPEQLAPVKLYLAHYDAHLPELQAAYQARIEEQERLAAEEKANPKVPEDIVVQFRVLSPEEIVPTTTSPKTSEK